jgi:hypothetical protein
MWALQDSKKIHRIYLYDIRTIPASNFHATVREDLNDLFPILYLSDPVHIISKSAPKMAPWNGRHLRGIFLFGSVFARKCFRSDVY